MAYWHATADHQTLPVGAILVIASHADPLRIIRADQVSIELPDGQRAVGLVVDRGEGTLGLALSGGSIVNLTVRSSLLAPSYANGGGYSEEAWVVN